MTYTIGSDIYKTSVCTLPDIPLHFSKVQNVIAKDMVEIYQERMKESTSQHLALKVCRNGELKGFIYTTVKDKIGEGVSIWAIDSVSAILLMKDAFTEYPSHKILVKPHGSEFILYKSLVLVSSIRNHYATGSPLVIHLKKVVEKYSSAFLKLGASYG